MKNREKQISTHLLTVLIICAIYNISNRYSQTDKTNICLKKQQTTARVLKR